MVMTKLNIYLYFSPGRVGLNVYLYGFQIVLITLRGQTSVPDLVKFNSSCSETAFLSTLKDNILKFLFPTLREI